MMLPAYSTNCCCNTEVRRCYPDEMERRGHTQMLIGAAALVPAATPLGLLHETTILLSEAPPQLVLHTTCRVFNFVRRRRPTVAYLNCSPDSRADTHCAHGMRSPLLNQCDTDHLLQSSAPILTHRWSSTPCHHEGPGAVCRTTLLQGH